MATGITPFGESFADPRKYMGQSPLAEVGKAAKTFLTGYALKESGFTDYLNSLGKKAAPQGAVAPSAPTPAVAGASPAAVQPPQQFVAPMLPQPVQPTQQGVLTTPAPDNNAPPADIGNQILDGTWTGFPSAPVGPTSLKNPTDFNPLAPDTSNQIAVSGNDYQQIPGYGSLKEKMGKLSMLMGMG